MSRMIGLTGGIGSGKSTAAAIMASLGGVVIDADRIAHEIYLPGTDGHAAVLGLFGDDVLAADGSIDRLLLGQVVFNDRSKLAQLNGLIHPLVRSEVAGRMADAHNDHPQSVVVVEAALMTETGWTGGVGELWAVLTDPELVVDRLVSGRGMTIDEVGLRVAAQTDNEARREVADRVIENNGTVDELERAVEVAWLEFTGEGPAA